MMFSLYQNQLHVFLHVQVQFVKRYYHFLYQVINVLFVDFHFLFHVYVLIIYHWFHLIFHVQLLNDIDDEENLLIFYLNFQIVQLNVINDYVVDIVVQFQMKLVDRPREKKRKKINNKNYFFFSNAIMKQKPHTYII